MHTKRLNLNRVTCSTALKNDDDLHRGQRSTEVKHSKLCYMAIKLGQINLWCKFRMTVTFMEVNGQQRLNIVNNDLWLPNLVRFADTSLGWLWPSQRSKVSKGHNDKQFSIATKLGRKSSWCKFRMTVTVMEVKCQQRSNTVNNICTTYMIFGE